MCQMNIRLSATQLLAIDYSIISSIDSTTTVKPMHESHSNLNDSHIEPFTIYNTHQKPIIKAITLIQSSVGNQVYPKVMDLT